MTTSSLRIHVDGVDRDMTPEEIAVYEQTMAEIAADYLEA